MYLYSAEICRPTCSLWYSFYVEKAFSQVYVDPKSVHSFTTTFFISGYLSWLTDFVQTWWGFSFLRRRVMDSVGTWINISFEEKSFWNSNRKVRLLLLNITAASVLYLPFGCKDTALTRRWATYSVLLISKNLFHIEFWCVTGT